MFKKGFTLIELLIVIAVISILVGIAIPRFLGMRQEGNIAKARGEMHALQAALEAYRIHEDVFPAETNWQNTLEGMTPRIIEGGIEDPFNVGNDYGYQLSTNGEYYVIYSEGPDVTATINGICDDGRINPANTLDDVFITNGPGTKSDSCI